MDLLLDTHTFLWFVWNDPQLSVIARSLIVDPANRKLISAASHWEIAIKVSTGKLNLGEPFRSFMHREITRNILDAAGGDTMDKDRNPHKLRVWRQAKWEAGHARH